MISRLRNANSRHVSVSVEGTSSIYGIPLEENEHLGQSVMSFEEKLRLDFNKNWTSPIRLCCEKSMKMTRNIGSFNANWLNANQVIQASRLAQ